MVENKHYCLCGCGQEIVYKSFHEKYGTPKYIWGHHNKIYIRENKKGKKLEEIYGIQKAKNIKNKLSVYNKGKTYEEIFGKEQAEQKKEKQSHSHKLRYINNYNLAKQISIKNTKWTKEKIIEAYLRLPNIYMIEWNDYRIKGKLPDINALRIKFGSINNFIKITNKPFKENVNEWSIGKNEKELINKKEEELKIKFKRQFFINGFWIDGYNKEKNIVIEVDELHHKYGKQKIYDIKRENIIKELLGCQFIRIKDGWQ